MFSLKKVAVILFYIMFIYSGFNKILKFNQKVSTLMSKTNLPYMINMLGIIGVILLEIFGSLIIILYYFDNKYINKKLFKFVKLLFLLFLIVVTFLYHPPTDKIIPFLSNLTTFGALLYMYSDK